MMIGLFSCNECNEIFRTRTALENHVRAIHQPSVKVKFLNGDAMEIKRANDGEFKCDCGRGFKLPYSMQKHAKICSGQRTDDVPIDENLTESGDESEMSDLSELDAAADELPADCFGIIIQNFIDYR
jgi:hypothetical protein